MSFRTAGPFLTRCHTLCRGLCCRNINVDALVQYGDFVFILTLAGELRKAAQHCLKAADPLFPQDCIFLRDGAGPCIFPENLRPQICVTAFCMETPPARPAIRRVKRAFFKLDYHLVLWAWANFWCGLWRIRAPDADGRRSAHSQD